jgi:hypothetical protein
VNASYLTEVDVPYFTNLRLSEGSGPDEKNGVREYAAYDDFDPECMVFEPSLPQKVIASL